MICNNCTEKGSCIYICKYICPKFLESDNFQSKEKQVKDKIIFESEEKFNEFYQTCILNIVSYNEILRQVKTNGYL